MGIAITSAFLAMTTSCHRGAFNLLIVQHNMLKAV